MRIKLSLICRHSWKSDVFILSTVHSLSNVSFLVAFQHGKEQRATPSRMMNDDRNMALLCFMFWGKGNKVTQITGSGELGDIHRVRVGSSSHSRFPRYDRRQVFT